MKHSDDDEIDEDYAADNFHRLSLDETIRVIIAMDRKYGGRENNEYSEKANAFNVLLLDEIVCKLIRLAPSEYERAALEQKRRRVPLAVRRMKRGKTTMYDEISNLFTLDQLRSFGF